MTTEHGLGGNYDHMSRSVKSQSKGGGTHSSNSLLNFLKTQHIQYIGINTTIYGGSDLPFKTLNYCWPTVAIVFVYRYNTIKTFTMSQKCIPNKCHSSELFTQRILKKCIMVSKKILRSTLNINKTDKSITSVSMSVFGFKIHIKKNTDYYRNKMWFCTWLSVRSQST